MAVVIVCNDFGAQENKLCPCFYFFPSIFFICKTGLIGITTFLHGVWQKIHSKMYIKCLLCESTLGSLKSCSYLLYHQIFRTILKILSWSQHLQKCIESAVRMVEIISNCQSGINDISHRWGSKNLPAALSMSFTSLLAQLVKNHMQHQTLGSIPGLGQFPGEGKGYPFQYSGLENSLDCIVHGVAKSQTWPSNFHFHFTFCIQMLWQLGLVDPGGTALIN